MQPAAAQNPPSLQSDAQHYKRDGYFIARQIVPRAEVEQVFADMHRLVAQQLKQREMPHTSGESPEDVHDDMKALFNRDLKGYIATLTLCGKLASLYQLYMNPNVQAFTRAIGIEFPVFQTAPVMHLMSHALKVPNGYQGFGAHQDWPTLQGGLDTVTVWVPFVDIDRKLFTMEIIPGSHKGGLYPYTRRDHIFEVDPACYDAKQFVPMEVRRGDIVFMSSFAIHRSSLDGDNRLRVSTSWRYENAAESHFIARNYPTGHKRSVLPDLITPNFPSIELVKKTFD